MEVRVEMSITEEDVEVVKRRCGPLAAEYERRRVRRVSPRIANRVRNALSQETIRDSGCTFRAFRRECLRDLVLYRGLHRFIPTLLRLRGYRVIEVEVNPRPRRFGRSK